jgi:hypothetical protein
VSTANTCFQNPKVKTDTLQLQRSNQIILLIMQQYLAPASAPNPTGWSQTASAIASGQYSRVRTAFPNANEPSQSNLQSLRNSLRPFLQDRLEASWATNARGTDQVGRERIDVTLVPGSVIVSVQVPIRRYEALYHDARGRPLRYPETRVSGITVQAQAKSVFDPQTQAWTGIQL